MKGEVLLLALHKKEAKGWAIDILKFAASVKGNIVVITSTCGKHCLSLQKRSLGEFRMKEREIDNFFHSYVFLLQHQHGYFCKHWFLGKNQLLQGIFAISILSM
jgi:hypothetical protein